VFQQSRKVFVDFTEHTRTAHEIRCIYRNRKKTLQISLCSIFPRFLRGLSEAADQSLFNKKLRVKKITRMGATAEKVA